MNQEISRQLVHLSGIIFVILAQFIGNIVYLYFFLAAIFFVVYSEYVRQEQKQINRVINYMESKIRGIATGLERKTAKRQFMGAFWFYFGCGLTFFIFPFEIATVACVILSVSDAFSTLIGHKYGKTKMVGNKSLEGLLAFIISGVIVTSFITNFWAALAAVLVGAVAEMIPDIPQLNKLKANHIVDDNYLIPLLSAFAIYLGIIF